MIRAAKWTLLVIFPLWTFLANTLRAQTCGGTERWPVKVGTDTGVGNVDLSTQIPKGVPEMLGLTEPQRPPKKDNNTRLEEETHVYAVTGHLIKFKLESGDGGDEDYHMVISDDSLLFTNERKGQPPGHSLVAEIPDPNCIAGQEGDPSIQSRFIDSIRASRQKLEAQFQNIDPSGNFNDAGGIAVCIVGIAFFDFPHKQIGRATNNVEIHPVLNISFSPCATRPPDTTPSSQTATAKRNVRLRTNPDTASDIIKTLPAGTKVTVIDPAPQNGYLHVRTKEGGDGWIWAKFLDVP